MAMPKVTVAAPPSLPVRYGLQSVVVPRTDELERVLYSGAEYDSDSCGWDSDGTSVWGGDPSCGGGTAVTLNAFPAWVEIDADTARLDLSVSVNGGGQRPVLVSVNGGPARRVRTNAVTAIVASQLRDVPVAITVTDPYSGTSATGTVTIPNTTDAFGAPGGGLDSILVAGLAGAKAARGSNDDAGYRSTSGGMPFTVFQGYSCAGVPLDEARAKLERQFAAREPSLVEAAFWWGNDGLVSPSLAGSPYNSVSPEISPGIVDAVARLEEAYYWGATNLGVIHAPRWTYPYAAAAGLIVRDRNQLRTPADTLWAFGAGYDSYTGPADGPSANDGQAWMYMTGPVSQWRGDVAVIPQDGAALDRATNNVELLAERTYVLAVDCDVISTLADLTGAVLGATAGGGGGF